jgi:rubrerythrin
MASIVSTSQSAEVLKVLNTCHAIELASERLYSVFAEIHASHPTVAQLWHKTAREELQHAAQFRLLMGAYGSAIERVEVDHRQALEALREVELMVSRARQQPPSIVDALRFAVQLEERLAGFHAAAATVFKQEAHRKLFRAMMAADDRHTDALREALVAYELAR